MSTGFSATNTRVAGDTLNIAAPAAIAPSLPRSASAVSESSIPPGCGFPSPNSKLSPCPPTPAPLPETPRASFWGVPCSCAATSPASTWPPLRSGKTHAESDHCDKTVRPSPDARQPLVFFLSLNCECDFSCTQRRKSHGWVVDAPGLPLTIYQESFLGRSENFVQGWVEVGKRLRKRIRRAKEKLAGSRRDEHWINFT